MFTKIKVLSVTLMYGKETTFFSTLGRNKCMLSTFQINLKNLKFHQKICFINHVLTFSDNILKNNFCLSDFGDPHMAP